MVDAWMRILQREVRAATSGTWLGNDDTRRAPFIVVWGSAEGLHPLGARCGFVTWSRSCSCLSLATMTVCGLVLQTHR
jgi:hypothetical protein